MLASWHGFFDWYGWSALVAIGTLLLATSTAGLALLTRRLAREAGNETRANWRPVMAVQPFGLTGTTLSGSVLSVLVSNIGRGPALGVRGYLQDAPWDLGKVKGEPSRDAAAPGEIVAVEWPGFVSPIAPRTLKGEIVCEDVSGASYTTSFVLSFEEKGVTLTPHVHSDARLPATAREIRVMELRRWWLRVRARAARG